MACTPRRAKLFLQGDRLSSLIVRWASKSRQTISSADYMFCTTPYTELLVISYSSLALLAHPTCYYQATEALPAGRMPLRPCVWLECRSPDFRGNNVLLAYRLCPFSL